MPQRRVRLDALVVERGLAATRARARALILAGRVTVDGTLAAKAGTPTARDADVALCTPDHPWVGRGGVKLAHALEVFGLDVSNRTALDVGASTGGFTDVLLQRGARHVAALDVGHGQLAWALRRDPRVTVIEGVNARALDPRSLPATARDVDLVTVDVSFISLRLILPRLPSVIRAGGHAITLVKPQFEATRAEVGKHGVVRDPTVHRRVVDELTRAATGCGFVAAGTTPSPITGAEGNREFFLHLTT